MKLLFSFFFPLFFFCQSYPIRLKRQSENVSLLQNEARHKFIPTSYEKKLLFHDGSQKFQVNSFSNIGRPGFLTNNEGDRQQQFDLSQQKKQQIQQSFSNNFLQQVSPSFLVTPLLHKEQLQLQKKNLPIQMQTELNQTEQILTLQENFLATNQPQKIQSISLLAQNDGGSATKTKIISEIPTTTVRSTPSPPVDKNVDLDGDGALSLAEVQYAAFVHHGLSSSVVENLFNQVDQNKDGYLNYNEFNEIRPLVLTKAENAAQRYLQNVDTDHNNLLSLSEAQAYVLKEYGISNRDVERIWRLVVPSNNDEMDAVLFSKLRRRIRGMSIRLARQIMKMADKNEDGHINLKEAQMIAFEQEGIGANDVIEMLASVDDNNDGELNAPEFADFERIVRARAVDTSKKALKFVDTDGSGTVTMSEAKQIAFDHYGFDEATLEPFFAQADENEDNQLDAVEFSGFRSVIRSRAVKNAMNVLPEIDEDGDSVINLVEAERKARRDDDMDFKESHGLFNVADQDKSGYLDKVELADFIRLVRLSAIKFVNDHLREYDTNRDKLVTVDELESIITERYHAEPYITRRYFDKVDVDRSGDLNAGEIVDFRHEIRRYVTERNAQAELEEQNRREMAEIEAKLQTETEVNKKDKSDEIEQIKQVDESQELKNEIEETNTSEESINLQKNNKKNKKTQTLIENKTKVKTTSSKIEKSKEKSEDLIEDVKEEESAEEFTTTTPILSTTTIATTIQPSTKMLKKKKRVKNKTTNEMFVTTTVLNEFNQKPIDLQKPTNTFDLPSTITTTLSNKIKRRRKLRKQSTVNKNLNIVITSTDNPTTIPTTTMTTTTTTMSTTTTTIKPSTAPFNEDFEECKENESDCEEIEES